MMKQLWKQMDLLSKNGAGVIVFEMENLSGLSSENPIYLSVHPSVFLLSIYLYITYLSICLSVHPSIFLSSIYLYITYLSIYL